MGRTPDAYIMPLTKIMEPQKLTEHVLGELGWLHCRTEIKSGIRTDDLMGFVDSLAFPPPARCVAIQTTAQGHAMERVRKIALECTDLATAWLIASNEIEVWEWCRRTPRDGSEQYWGCRVIPVDIEVIAELQTHQLARDAEGEQ